MPSEIASHYEKKYAGQKVEDAGSLRLSRAPGNRFEACQLALKTHFSGGSILEIGAGDGTIARRLLAADVPFSRYAVTDLSTTRTAAAMESLSDPRFEVFPLDVEAEFHKVSGQTFDAVIMVALIEHLIDPIKVMRNIASILNGGGFVYIDTPNIAKYTRRIKLAFGYFPATASRDEGLLTYDGRPVDLFDEGHFHYFSYRSLEQMLTRYCGFSAVEKCPYWGAGSAVPPALGKHAARLWPEMFSEVAVICRK
ncbi:MAG TPA: class I SAM-dependent methyltransferase [Azospirillum sp.]|nr:class I SAM-dependent methyltransferase [Azospirillum sp.]